MNLVIGMPALIGYSLENRLKPRLQEANDCGMIIDEGCLRQMGCYTNEKWSRRIDKHS